MPATALTHPSALWYIELPQQGNFAQNGLDAIPVRIPAAIFVAIRDLAIRRKQCFNCGDAVEVVAYRMPTARCCK